MRIREFRVLYNIDEQGRVVRIDRIGQKRGSLAWFREALDLPALTLADIPESTSWKPGQDDESSISHEQLLAELRLNSQLVGVEAAY